MLVGTSTAGVKRNPPNLQSLQERIMHAKNLSMRMEELFRKEQQLMEEKASYTTLLSLKEETEWLLGVVEKRLTKGGSSDSGTCGCPLGRHRQNPAVGVGHRPTSHMPWTTLQPNLIHIHKTLCLASRNQPSNEIEIESHLIEDEFDGPHIVQLLIQQFRQNNVGLTWPFSVWEVDCILNR